MGSEIKVWAYVEFGHRIITRREPEEIVPRAGDSIWREANDDEFRALGERYYIEQTRPTNLRDWRTDLAYGTAEAMFHDEAAREEAGRETDEFMARVAAGEVTAEEFYGASDADIVYDTDGVNASDDEVLAALEAGVAEREQMTQALLTNTHYAEQPHRMRAERTPEIERDVLRVLLGHALDLLTVGAFSDWVERAGVDIDSAAEGAFQLRSELGREPSHREFAEYFGLI